MQRRWIRWWRWVWRGVALFDERQPVAAVVPDGARHLYYEASAMIIGLINLGLCWKHAHVSVLLRRWRNYSINPTDGAPGY